MIFNIQLILITWPLKNVPFYMLTSFKPKSFDFLRLITKDASQALFEKVDKIIEEKIRPAIASDGGDVSLEDIQNGCMVVSLSGACSHCPSKKITLRNGILGLVQDEVPEIVGIREKLDFEDL